MSNVIIINAYFPHEDKDKKIDELIALCESSDCVVKGHIDCLVTKITPATYIGKGKATFIKALADEAEADVVVFGGELSPSQTLSLADIIGRTVITKTNLILDIFARRARSDEGKVLVELAQLKYIYPRLKGKGDSLSRQGGGIGTVGPGETKLETDRRYIKGRIRSLEKSLKGISERRKHQQQRRSKNTVKTVAVVGYTNVGKSTLINRICGSDLIEMDKLFATLDPTARTARINGERVVFVDTVGFIKDLPESLLKAFKSTLEIAISADLILCVSDASDDFVAQREVTDVILDEIGAIGNRLYVLNKCDKIKTRFYPKEYLRISAKSGKGLDELTGAIFKNLFGTTVDYDLTVPYERSPVIASVKSVAQTVDISYGETAIRISGKVLDKNFDKLKSLIDN